MITCISRYRIFPPCFPYLRNLSVSMPSSHSKEHGVQHAILDAGHYIVKIGRKRSSTKAARQLGLYTDITHLRQTEDISSTITEVMIHCLHVTKFCAATRYDKLAQGVHYITRTKENNIIVTIPDSKVYVQLSLCAAISCSPFQPLTCLRTDVLHYLRKKNKNNGLLVTSAKGRCQQESCAIYMSVNWCAETFNNIHPSLLYH